MVILYFQREVHEMYSFQNLFEDSLSLVVYNKNVRLHLNSTQHLCQ